jgi:hypothetical protein
MNKKTKPALAPTSNKGDVETDLQLGKVSSARQDFLIAAANMSWQLAIVVLVPVIGGNELDKHFHSLPLWTIVGFVIAMIGMAGVVWRQLQLFTPSIPPATKKRPTAKGHHS